MRASGVEYPLAVGNALSQAQLFESVLLAELGVDGFRALWDGSAPVDPAALLPAIDAYSRLLAFSDPSSRARTPGEVTESVIRGDAAYLVRADDALATFRSAGMVFGEQFSGRPAPGTSGAFLLQADAFTLPVGASHPDAARAWLRTVASAEQQRVVSVTRGSIPASSEVTSGGLDDYQALTMIALGVALIVPSLSGGVAADAGRTDAVMSAVERFGADGRADALANALLAGDAGK